MILQTHVCPAADGDRDGDWDGDVRRKRTDLGWRMVRQSSAQHRKNASGRVSCRCSMSSNGTSSSSPAPSSSSSLAPSPVAFVEVAATVDVAVAVASGLPAVVVVEDESEGLHVAADGIFAFVSSNEIILPSANAASASAAAWAIARARSTLNCLRSARRFAVISSEVIWAFCVWRGFVHLNGLGGEGWQGGGWCVSEGLHCIVGWKGRKGGEGKRRWGTERA